MEVKRIHIAKKSDEDKDHYIRCIVDVPGLGELEIKDCISIESIEGLSAQVIEFTRQKLNIKANTILNKQLTAKMHRRGTEKELKPGAVIPDTEERPENKPNTPNTENQK